MKITITEKQGWYDYMVEHEDRELFGTCSDFELALESVRKAEENIKYKSINPRRNP